MKTTADGLGALCSQAYLLPQLQNAGARVGVFSNADYAEDLTLGRGYEWNVPGRCLAMRVWRSAASANQGLWKFGESTTTGWGLISGNARDTRIFFRPSSSSRLLATPTFLGLSSYVFGIQDTLGNARCSVNGGAAFAATAPATYVPAGASAVHSWGKWQSEGTFAAAGSSILQLYVIEGYDSAGVTSDAALQYLSGDVNQLHRWQCRPEVPVHPRLLMYINAPDWNGVAGSNFIAAGSGGSVFKMQGTGGGKTTMPAYDRYRIPLSARVANAIDRYYENGARVYSIFSMTQFSTDAADTAGGPAGLTIDTYGKNIGVVGDAEAGVSVNGTNLAGNNIMDEMDSFDLMRANDIPGIVAGAAKPVVLTEGLQTIVLATSEIKPNASPQFIRVPHGSSVVWGNAYAPIADVDIYDHDSLLCQVSGLNDNPGIKGPPVNACTMLQRVSVAPRRVACCGMGTLTWFQRIGDATKRASTLAQYRAQARGSSSNRFRIQLGTNDWFFVTYGSLVTLTSDIVTTVNGILAFGVPGTLVQLIGTTDRTGGTVNNGAGWNIPDLRTAIQNAVIAVGDVRVTYVDASTWVDLANRPGDGLHYNTAGHIQYDAQLTANPP